MKRNEQKQSELINAIFESFAYPELIKSLTGMDITNQESDIISSEIVVEQYLTLRGLNTKIAPARYAETILNNQAFNSKELILAAEKILVTSEEINETIKHIVSLSYRYIHNQTFKEYIDNAYKHNIEVNPLLTDDFIRELYSCSHLTQHINFIEFQKLNLLPNSHLVSDIEEFFKIGVKTGTFGYFAEDWHSMTIKEFFLIYTEEPEPVIFKICKNSYMQWFVIDDVTGLNNYAIHTDLIFKMARQIMKPENQSFFGENYLQGYPHDDSNISPIEKNITHFRVGHQLLDKMTNIDSPLEVKHLSIKEHKHQEELFQTNSEQMQDGSHYNQIKLSISKLFVKVEADHQYLLSKIESSQLLNELVRRKSDKLYNYLMDSIEREFLLQQREGTTSRLYEITFKNALYKLNIGQLTKATQQADVAALLLKINQQIQHKTANEILESIPNIDVLVEYLERKGCYVRKKEQISGYSLFKFLCDRLNIGYVTEKSKLMKMLENSLNESAF
ncbi:hypothetical protein QA597_10630 [Marinilabiliaceae bacterium ANBcel2]|nr:hypothetical protein [Marinilabiliaceae bacterium ANBcel2]